LFGQPTIIRSKPTCDASPARGRSPCRDTPGRAISQPDRALLLLLWRGAAVEMVRRRALGFSPDSMAWYALRQRGEDMGASVFFGWLHATSTQSPPAAVVPPAGAASNREISSKRTTMRGIVPRGGLDVLSPSDMDEIGWE
jgi:hypothetical protein